MTVDWLVDITEEWCKERAIFLAVSESINIITDDKKKGDKNTIPDILKDALSVSFDTNIGHDYLENVDNRYDFYARVYKLKNFQLLNY